MNVHGDPNGIYIHQKGGVWRRASMGYAIREVEKAFKGKKFTLAFESCEVGYAYADTIRGMKDIHEIDLVTDVDVDYDHVPPFPVWGANLWWDGIGPICYTEHKNHFYRWWTDLRQFDPKGAAKPLLPLEKENPKNHLQPTTQQELETLLFLDMNS